MNVAGVGHHVGAGHGAASGHVRSRRAVGVLAVDDLVFFNDTATTEIYTLSLHDALPISVDVLAGDGADVGLLASEGGGGLRVGPGLGQVEQTVGGWEATTAELLALRHLVCRLLIDEADHHT